MRTKIIVQRVVAFERVIDALAEDLIESTDEELLQAAHDLGMNPMSRGSAAFAGIKYPATWNYSDFFSVPNRRPELLRSGDDPDASPSRDIHPSVSKKNSDS